MYDAVRGEIESWPQWMETIIAFVTSSTVLFILAMLVTGAAYYHRIVSRVRAALNHELRDLLHIEREDKKFLLTMTHTLLSEHDATELDRLIARDTIRDVREQRLRAHPNLHLNAARMARPDDVRVRMISTVRGRARPGASNISITVL